jgi:hypothetical protein
MRPGVAEAELEADVASTLRRVTFSLSGDGPGGIAGMLAPGEGFLHRTIDPDVMPDRVDMQGLSHAQAEFRRTGFAAASIGTVRCVPVGNC